MLPMNPVPTVRCIKSLGRLVELFGENFSTQLQVWFDDVPAVTIFRCDELMLCKPPDLSAFADQSDIAAGNTKVDFVIYSGYYFSVLIPVG